MSKEDKKRGTTLLHLAASVNDLVQMAWDDVLQADPRVLRRSKLISGVRLRITMNSCVTVRADEHQVVFLVPPAIGEKYYLMLLKNRALNIGIELVRWDEVAHKTAAISRILAQLSLDAPRNGSAGRSP